jgi:hypothetical protein
MFAIASDDVEQVKQALESGGVNPNEAVGPQSALAFTLTNDKLTNKLEIVKALLAYGADPESVKVLASGSSKDATSEDKNVDELDSKPLIVEDLDYATRSDLSRTRWYSFADLTSGTTLNAQMLCTRRGVLLSSNVPSSGP